MAPKLYYGIPAYNEEENILNCLAALDRQTIDAEVETIICVSKSTDRTMEKIQEGIVRYPHLNIKIISCGLGKSLAQRTIAKYVEDKTVPIAFVDADVVPEKRCMEILYNDLRDIGQLVAVGAWPMPMKMYNLSPWERFMHGVLNVRALNPEAEISANDVSSYKWYADKYRQPTISVDFEKRSKIFFHGRTFMLRNAAYVELPIHENAADDTYLPNYIHTTYGPGTIRLRYDALVYYKPYISLMKHFYTYWRVYSDLRVLDRKGMFKESREKEKLKWDWDYIMSRGTKTALNFIFYRAIKALEHTVYSVLPKRTLVEIWRSEKEHRNKMIKGISRFEVLYNLSTNEYVATKT